MAFIRKHRLMLVPLFLVAALGAGLFLLLRSESEEPGNVSLTYPRVTVQAWQEDVSKRTQHGREYRFVRTVEYVDPETQEIVTEEIVSTVRERGSNLCYRDAEGDWVPTVAEWEPDGLGFKMDRNNWQIEVGQTLYSAYDYTVGGKTLVMRPTRILLSDGVHTVSLDEIDTNVAGQIDENDPSKLVFRDVLGENSGVDIELVLERASLHQNVVLRAKPALPEGFNAETAHVYVYTELGLDAITADGSVGVKLGDTAVDVSANDLVTERNTTDSIAFVTQEHVGGETRELVLHRFVKSRVWDSAASRNETCAARQLWRSPVDSKTYLVESIPFSYVAEATGAITIDYENQNGDIDDDETWTADATYYVSGDVNISGTAQDPVTLTIEPGTVIKFDDDSAINVGAYGTIIAAGEPYGYIIFTSKEDDSSGEDLTSSSTTGTKGDYDTAINIDVDASTSCAVEYCKIGYATDGIVSEIDFGTILHCIIRDIDDDAMVFDGSGAPDVFNCLIADIDDRGISVYAGQGVSMGTVSVQNCTIEHCGSYGVYVSWWSYPYAGSVSVMAGMNLFTNNATGVYFASGGTSALNYNGWYGNTTDVSGGAMKGPDAITLAVSPYDPEDVHDGYNPSPLGKYFVDTTNVAEDPDGEDLVDAGSGAASGYYSDATLFSIEAPEVVDSDITSGAPPNPAEWSKRSGDTGTVDIGYHHPRVDKVINATRSIGHASNAVTLKIDPGVAVAFSGSSARLKFKSDAGEAVGLTCDGLPSDPIILAGKPVVSMDVEAQYINASWWNYPHKGIQINDSDATETASVTYTRVIGLHKGIEVAIDMETPNDVTVKHCVFERGITALYTTGAANRDITVTNCLFHCNKRGAIAGLAYCSTTTLTLRNCTFDRNGINLTLSSGTNATVNIKDCLFSNAEEGIRLSSAIVGFTRDHNAFWNCGPNNTKKIWKTYDTEEELPIGTNSIVLLKDPYDTGWTNWSDQWHLHQSVVKDGTEYVKDISACVDGGSQDAKDAGLDLLTTRLTSSSAIWFDVGTVDIGYHYGVDYEEAVTEIYVTNVYCTTTAGSRLTIEMTFENRDNDYYYLIEIYEIDQNGSPLGDPIYSTENAHCDTGFTWTWDGTGATHDGTYLVKVSSEDTPSSFSPFHFYAHLDTSVPTGFKIAFPATGPTSGY